MASAADDAPARGVVDRRQRRVHLAAQQMHDTLAVDPRRYRATPKTTGALALAGLVLGAAAACLAALVWATVAFADGYLWIPFGVAWLVTLFVLTPWRHRLPDGALLLSRDEQPALHALVEMVAELVEVDPPHAIAVTTDLNAGVTLRGWRGRSALLLGLPLWTLENPDQRIGTLAHELGHLKGRDLLRGRVIGGAGTLLGRLAYLLGPDDGNEFVASNFDAPVTGGPLFKAFQSVLALPFRGVLAVLYRLELASSQHREYLADRRAAEIVGTVAMRQTLAEDLRGIWTRVTAGVRRGENPFELLEQVPTPDAAAVDAFSRYSEQQLIQADVTHPPNHLRLSLLAAYFLPPSPERPSGDMLRQADVEMRALRPALRKRLVHELKDSWY